MRNKFIIVILLLLMSITLSGCGNRQAFTSIEDPLATSIATPTFASAQTVKALPTPLATVTPTPTQTSTVTPDFYTSEEMAIEGEWWTYSLQYNYDFGDCSSKGEKRIQVNLPEPGGFLQIDEEEFTRESPNNWIEYLVDDEIDGKKINNTITLTIYENKMIQKDVLSVSGYGTSACETVWIR